MKRLGIVAVAGLLAASPLASSQALAATEADASSAWNSYVAEAIAQGIAYQFTFDGDSLATGTAERYGGLVSGSMPYAYTLTSDSRRGGIGSVFWPSYALTVWREGAPLLMDRIPFYGERYPEQVDTGVRLVADTVPFSYPFAVYTNGAKPAEFTAMPTTEIPGGSVGAATMRCVPETISLHCHATADRLQLGAPNGQSAAVVGNFQRALDNARASLGVMAEEPKGAVTVETVDTTAHSIVDKDVIKSLSNVLVKNLDVLGAVRLGTIQAAATNVTDGTTANVERTVAVTQASVGGQPVTIGRDGVSLAGNAAMTAAEYDKANQQLRDSLSDAGVTIRLFGGVQKSAREGGGSRDEGEALYIGLKLPNPGLQGQFFYLNYWLGATVTSTSGVPSAGTASTDN